MLKAIVLTASLFVVGTAVAEETTIIKRTDTPAVRVETAPPIVERRSTTVTTGCDTTVIHKQNDLGDSKTVKKTDC